ncbi:hypothetical protein QTP88_017122 [Uroleucon formosanum]
MQFFLFFRLETVKPFLQYTVHPYRSSAVDVGSPTPSASDFRHFPSFREFPLMFIIFFTVLVKSAVHQNAALFRCETLESIENILLPTTNNRNQLKYIARQTSARRERSFASKLISYPTVPELKLFVERPRAASFRGRRDDGHILSAHVPKTNGSFVFGTHPGATAAAAAAAVN